ncbi:hypothetical protein C3B72_08685 [Clostridium tetani]|uniref:hypothetical protein n=1 Tax=Clostridium tetani TaxID=1513 RepID=UPI000D20B4DF|nr:hypothetical protein [Clostridium tetani]AVP55217.1 hypothetical protein C3B72_08685 [Clostridium tetani]
MLYKYIKKHFNIIFFITITLISMIISLNFQDLRAVFISLEMIYIIAYFILEQLTGKVYINQVLCMHGIALGILIVYFLRLMNLPDRNLKLLNKLDALKIASIPYIILFIIILFIVKPLYAKAKNKTVFKIIFSIFLIVFLFCTLRFYFSMI